MGFKDTLRQIVTPVLVPSRAAGTAAPPAPSVPLRFAADAWATPRAERDAVFSMGYVACELAKMRPVSSLPVHVYRSSDGGREEARDPVPFYLSNLIRTRWNPLLKATDGIRWAMFTKDTLGSAYVRVEWAERQGMMVPVALWPLWGHVSKLWDDEDKALLYDYGGDDTTPPGRYLDRDVVEFRSPLPDPTGTGARSLAQACAAAISLDIDLYEFYQRLIDNGTHMPKWLETDESLSPQDRQELAASLAATRGLTDAGGLRLFEHGIKVRQSEASMADLSYLEESRWVLQTLCRVTGVPPNEVYDNSQLTYSGNVEMSAIQFSQKTLTPECRELEVALDGVLRSAGVFDTHVKFDINGLLRGQYESRMKGYQVGLFSGFFTVNEVREWEELPRVEGGDSLMWPTNYYERDPETGELVPPPSQETGGAPGAAGDIPSAPDKELAEAEFHRSYVARVRERVADTGDTPATREFAAKVLAPWAHFCARAGIPYDFDAEIEELMSE